MKLRKILAVICMCGISANACMLRPCAESGPDPLTSEPAESDTRTEGLIQSYSLSITSGYKCIYVTASTIGTETMAEIGFKDIEIQRSSNGYSGWTPYIFPEDAYDEDAVSYYWYNHQINVMHGYYYRIVLTHYAIEDAWLFPDTQNIENTSNSVYV